MSTKDDAKWLADFYQKVAEGGQMQWRQVVSSQWLDIYVGPHLDTDVHRALWRVVPEPRTWYLFIPDDPAKECECSVAGWYTDKWSRNGTVVKVVEVIEEEIK